MKSDALFAQFADDRWVQVETKVVQCRSKDYWCCRNPFKMRPHAASFLAFLININMILKFWLKITIHASLCRFIFMLVTLIYSLRFGLCNIGIFMIQVLIRIFSLEGNSNCNYKRFGFGCWYVWIREVREFWKLF